MKSKSLLKQIQRRYFLTKPVREGAPCFKSYDQISSIGIFVSFVQLEEAREIVNLLKKDGIKNVSVYVVVSEKNTMQNPDFKELLFAECKAIDSKKFSWLGEPNRKLKKEMSASEFDAIIDFSAGNIGLQHLILVSPCNFRIGIEEPDYPFYDFTVLKQEYQTLVEIFMEIKKYLCAIRANKIINS